MKAIGLLPFLSTLLLFAGCEDDGPASDFERRYVLVAIPGFETEDFAELLDHEDPNLRYLAVANLTASGALTPASGETDEEARDFQANLAERVRELLKDSEPKVRAIAAHAPSNQAGSESEADLIVLLEDESATVRVEALAALANLESLSETGIRAIAGQLNDGNMLLRLHAVSAIGASCPQPQREAIARQLIELIPERETAEQLVILQSLGALGTGEAEQLVFAKLQSDDARMVRAAIDIVSEMESGNNTETAILAALEKETAPEPALLSLLVTSASEASFPKAEELLSSEDPAMRKFGRSLLEAIGKEEARVVLLDAYHQLTPKVEAQFLEPDAEAKLLIGEHEALIQSIAKLSNELARLESDPESILELLSTGGAIEKRMALRKLRNNPLFDLNPLDPDTGPDLIAPLLALAGGDSAILRTEALKTLGHSVDARAKDALVSALDSPESGVREIAMEAALRHAGNTSDDKLLRELYGRRAEFTPVAWDDEETNLEIRLSLEDAVTERESEWTTRERYRQDLEPDATDASRLLAALFLKDDEASTETAFSVILEFLAGGSTGEKSFTIEVLENGEVSGEHVSRLREIAAAEEDETLRRRLEALIDQA